MLKNMKLRNHTPNCQMQYENKYEMPFIAGGEVIGYTTKPPAVEQPAVIQQVRKYTLILVLGEYKKFKIWHS